MKFSFLLFVLFISQTILSQQIDFVGSYQGLFHSGNFQTDLSLDISQINDTYDVRFNSLSQNAFGIPARDVVIAQDSLKFALQSDYYRYDFKGKILNDNTLALNLLVDGKSVDFQLTKLPHDDKSGIKSEDVRFRSENLLLYGTIYYPEKPNGKAIYIVTSSGNNDRSASRAEAVLFAKKGFITLHTDKRGTGISDGNWQQADIPTLCNDDMLAIQYLSQVEKLPLSKIGIKGSSQGASKVPYILSKLPELGFGIAVSCPGSSLLESDLNYWKNRNRPVIDPTDFDAATELQKAVFQYIAGDLSRDQLDSKALADQNQTWYDKVWIPEAEEVQTDKKLNYSPLPYFKQTHQPLLVIQGTMDEIIPPASMEIIKNSIASPENVKNKYVMLTGADHSMMFRGESDFPYWSVLHPDYMNEMLLWINEL
jgi:pimeloyl-ACP methyl ester carboxylesterase